MRLSFCFFSFKSIKMKIYPNFMPMPNLKILLKKRFPKINGFSILHCAVWVGARKEACLNCLFSDRFLLQKQTVRSTTTMVASSSSTVFLPNLSLQSDSNWKGIGKTRNVPPRIRNKNGRKRAFTSLKWIFLKTSLSHFISSIQINMIHPVPSTYIGSLR